ncbi:MAG: hypothetical protein ACQEVT_05295 [Pseudomonadota bacterium]|uniref:hypothetical protein n=1 Tax=Roseovarius TaxID=74030 RepID=UPI0022A8C31C|nr:hypothetical protein [Roseovarius sp. EGI FJ00037]MCZ0813665.1 hypothetical protein [Roseovarius sp. EGI FJ00037]
MTDSEDRSRHHSMAQGQGRRMTPSETPAAKSRVARLRAKMPGLEVVLLVIAILMIAVALPLEAEMFPFSDSSSAEDQ